MVAAQVEKFGVPKPATRPSLRGWDDMRSDMADLKDLMKVLINVAARSDKQVTFTPRPETAMDRFEAAERQLNTDHLYEQLGITSDQFA